MKCGILYVLYDTVNKNPDQKSSSYPEELKKSISSLRKYCDLPITIYTDGNVAIKENDFDNITVIQDTGGISCPAHRAIGIDAPYRRPIDPTERTRSIIDQGNFARETFKKLYFLKTMPYETTIYVDTDTIFYDDPSKLISKDYDLAICRDAKYSPTKKQGRLTRAFNTGFFIANRRKPFDELIKKAIEICECENSGVICDQPAINQALEHVLDITIMILPQRWNVRWDIRNEIEQCDVALHHWHFGPEYKILDK